MGFEDRKLECEECGSEFVWDASEQAYFAKKGFKETPKRCRLCRAKRKIEKEKEKDIVCLRCGKKAKTTQDLEEGDELICMECLVREQAKQEEESSQEETKK